MLRSLIAKFSRSLSERRASPRRLLAVPVRVWFEPDVNTPQNRDIARSMAIPGETVDVSRTGVGFLVSAIRINEKYLVGQDRELNIEIDLPTGKVTMKIVSRRYEKVGMHLSMEKFLIGAHIIRVDSDSNAAFDQFLQNKLGITKPPAGLELGID